MFMINEILNISFGRREEGLARLAWIHSLMANKPGFREALVGKYLGDSSRHTVLRCWRDEQAYLDFRATPDGSYGRSRPEGLYTNDPVVPQWNSLWEVFGTAQGSYLVKVQFEVPEDGWGAFDQQEQAIAELARDDGGLASYQLLRAKDKSEAMEVIRYANRDAMDQLLEGAEFGKALRAFPAGTKHLYTACYEIVSEVGPST